MSSDPSLLDQCFDRVLREAPGLLGRSLSATVASLQEAEHQSREVAQRDLISRAWWSLERQRPLMGSLFPQRLQQAFQHAGHEGPTSSLARMSDSSLLALVDDSSVNESLESARMLQTLMPVVEQALSMVDARMSSLIGLETVHAEKNPLRPSVFVRALRDLMTEREPDPQLRSLWMQKMAAPLARELSQLYGQVAQLLQQARVQEAGYRIRLVADPSPQTATHLSTRGWLEDGNTTENAGLAPSREGPQDAPQPMSLRMKDLARTQTPLQHQVLQAFMAGEQAVFDHPLDNAFFEQVRQELNHVDVLARLPQPEAAELEEERLRYRDLPVVDRPARSIDVASPLDAQQWGDYAAPHERSRVLLELKHQADKVSQAVGLDVVRKLVIQVSGDPLLLAPVREAVVALEPALLRLALAEPRYFNDGDHPARQWIEHVAQRSFRYNDEFSPGFEAFFEPVRSQVRALNHSGSADAAPFATALADLKTRWTADDQAHEQSEQRQLETLNHAERRQELADQIAWEISLRPDVFGAPGIVLDFLYGPWSLAIASAELAHPEGGPDPQGYRKVIGRLLWSTHSQVTLRQPSQLFQIVPGMLMSLRQGLEGLGKSPEETQTFFDALLKFHEPVLKLRRMRAQVDGQAAAPVPEATTEDKQALETLLAPASPAQQKPTPPEHPWIGARELASAGFSETLPLTSAASADAPDTAAGTLAAGETPEEADDDPSALLHRLTKGSWVDLYSGGEWLRAQLVWSSQKASLFMFTSHGGRAHTMTRRSCEKLMAKRWLRPVEARPVMDRALRQLTAAEATADAQ
jgi:Protein of unknown function (DUF1631)